MKRIIFTLILPLMMQSLFAHTLTPEVVHQHEQLLEDVTEILDTTLLKKKLAEVEQAHEGDPSELNRIRLGMVYHEVALNLSFLSKSSYKGYAKKSFDLLTKVLENPSTTPAFLPIVSAHRASALSLVSAETNKLKLLGQAFELFQESIDAYAEVSYAPEFLRGSVAENLPFLFFRKRRFAKKDFTSLIQKYESGQAPYTPKIMSFTYWAWANQYQGKKWRKQSVGYLKKAIALDPNFEGGRERAEELLGKWER